MADVQIGFVGVGFMGQVAHLFNYSTLPGCKVAALAEIREKLAAKVAAKYGVPKVYKSHEEMLSSEKLDGVVASQQFQKHGQLLPQLFEKNIAVFSEKPLGRNVETGEKILKAAQASKAKYFIGYHKRSDPAVLWAKSEIERLKASKELGAFKYVRITMPPGEWTANNAHNVLNSDEAYPHLPDDPATTGKDKAWDDAYVSFVNYYIHQVNLMRHLLGENYEVSYADPGKMLFVGTSVSGKTCMLEMAPYSTTVDWQETALVCFEKGYVKIELPAPLVINRPGKVTVFKDPGKGVAPQTITPELPFVHAMRQQALHFVKAIKGEETPLCKPEEALEDLTVARQYFAKLHG